MPTILVVSAPVDPPLTYGYHYLKRFTRFAAKQGHRVIFLSTVNLETFRDALLRYDPKLVILNGHGGSKSLEIADTVILGVVDYDPELGKKIYRQNPEWMAGRLVYLATCNTGKELAFRLIDYGAIAVCAFREPFVFLSEESASPERDELAKPSFISLLQFPLHLSLNRTAGDAFKIMKDAFKYYVLEAEKKGNEDQAKFLWHNYLNAIFLGDSEATLERSFF
jgi:hypothetical protein